MIISFTLISLILSPFAMVYFFRTEPESNKICYRRTPFNDIIINACRVLHDVYRVPAMLRNGILHTFVTYFRRSPPESELVTVPMDVTADDGTILRLDWFITEDQPERTMPTILMLHGLNGSASASYIKWMVWAAHRVGYQCCGLNNRGCGESVLKTPKGFNAAFTGDVNNTVDFIRSGDIIDPETPLFIIGFSLGAGILIKYLADNGERLISKVNGCVALCASFNMHTSCKSIETPLSVKKHIINRVLAKGLVGYARRHEKVLKTAEHLDLQRVYKSVTVRQFDSSFVVPLHGFRDIKHYYDECSTDTRLHLVQVPLLCINAADDPICPAHGVPVDAFNENENLFLTVVPTGGHVAFMHDWFDLSHSWMESASLEFIEAIHHNADRKEVSLSGLSEVMNAAE
uniref:AB hydrolase-1 domain-containing protein n=1 Tax=Spongospora subterranea TaxID=70186 RepID=A0A0H5R801_9EUKA|eukprot:CRZ10258.1 hypothetical protein [Spongospora subterranea]